ncbi:MAG: SIS domain-containing protein [Planctomycetes bacterium]|nr:SIS domain-containing protein [Planctomycetota bacterium]
MSWTNKVSALTALLNAVEFTDQAGSALPVDAGFARWVELTRALRDAGRTIYFVGNGASASMASHFSADLAKNARVHTQVFTDPSLVTAIGNDMGYEHVFSEPLRRRGQAGDMLVAISSSGRSPNIVQGVGMARELGMHVVGLSGMTPDNTLRLNGTLNIYVAATTYGNAETSHAAILHHWLDAMLGEV